MSIERERQLRIENARETTKTFSDQLAFRRNLRGIFSLLSGGFKGFPTVSGVAPAGESIGGSIGGSRSGGGGSIGGGGRGGGGPGHRVSGNR